MNMTIMDMTQHYTQHRNIVNTDIVHVVLNIIGHHHYLKELLPFQARLAIKKNNLMFGCQNDCPLG